MTAMNLDSARHFSIRASSSQKQRRRDASVKEGIARRASRRLEKLTTVRLTATDMKPDDWRGFQAWWRTIDQRLLQGLSEDELQRVWQLAWAHHHSVKYTDDWRTLILALHERVKAAAPPEPPGYWQRGREYYGECAARRDGW